MSSGGNPLHLDVALGVLQIVGDAHTFITVAIATETGAITPISTASSASTPTLASSPPADDVVQ
jgi:hypothetical protein